jgi:MFS superfamily sulfate permease-like transporter
MTTRSSSPDSIRPGLWSVWKDDVLASIVVFLVAFPLCMGIAIASGFPPERAAAAGIITGIIGGLIAGSIAGCPLQVSGPAAGLAVMVGQIVVQHGFAALAVIIVVAGAIQILAGVLRLGQWFRAVSPAVIEGMLAGIGILILAAQFHVMVDDAPPGSGRSFGGIINLLTIPAAVWKGLSQPVHRPAAIVGVLTILSVLIWAAAAPKKLRFIPAPLVGVFVAALTAGLWGLPVVFIGVPDNLLQAVNVLGGADWRQALNWTVVGTGAVLAFVASAESLLTATAVDSMQRRAPRTRYDRELIAQGTGNLCCGFLGVLPMTGVIVRSSANVLAGARTRLSTILHGAWLLVFASMLPQLLRLIPVASLAGILVFTGWKLMNPRAARRIAQYGKGELLIYVATLSTVVVVDLLRGILVGIGLAVAKLILTFSHLSLQLDVEASKKRTTLVLHGAATFIRLPKLADALAEVPERTELHVQFDGLSYIDHACLELLMNWEKQHQATGGSLVVDWDGLTGRFRATSAARREPAQATTPGTGDGDDPSTVAA